MGLLTKVNRAGVRYASTRQPVWKIGDAIFHGALAEDSIQARTVLSRDTKDFLSELNRQFANDLVDLSKHRQELYASIRKSAASGKIDLQSSAGITQVNVPAMQVPAAEKIGSANNAQKVISALNSGDKTCLIDLEDSVAPSAKNVLQGHYNIYQGIRGELVHEEKTADGKINRLQISPTPSTPIVRVRGLHLKEVHATAAHIGPIPATLFDIGTHLGNNGQYLQERNLGPFLLLPKLHDGVEAEVLEKVLGFCEKELKLNPNSTKVATLIETLPAAFLSKDIASALHNRIIGQPCGQVGELGSCSYYLSSNKSFILPASFSAPSGDALNTVDLVMKLPADLQDPSKRTEAGLRQDIGTALQYMGHFLQGNGAPKVGNAVVDLASFELSRHHIKSWIESQVEITWKDGSRKPVTMEAVEKIVNEESQALKNSGLALDSAQEVLIRGLKENPEHIGRTAGEYLNPDFGRGLVIGSRVLRVLQGTGGYIGSEYSTIKFDDDLVRSLLGSRPELNGVEVTKHRGRFLNRLLGAGTCYKYMGCASGLAAAAVVHGGNGLVGPYCGGWQLNAMGLEESRPDTLWVKPEDPGNLGMVLSNFLGLQDKIQMVDTIHQLQALRSLPPSKFREGIRALQSHVNKFTDFHDISVLADLEQGYGDVKYTRYGVTKAVKSGISMLHIEDQGPKKRCGHLGDKELDTFDHAVEIMTAANYAAQEALGPEQAKENFVRFVFRTDALSATRIVYSKAIEDPNHIDHKYVDWDRGMCADGRYMWLNKGDNPKTGNPYGLEQSIDRASEIVKRGLASFVWMETPDAEVRVAQAFLEGVNEKLKPTGRQALGLYNFSPSFIWDKNYYPEAKKLAAEVANFIQNQVLARLQSGQITEDQAKFEVRQFIDKNGDSVRGDNLITETNLERLVVHGLDHARAAAGWSADLQSATDIVNKQFPSNLKFRLQREIKRTQQAGYNPVHHMTNIIVGQRIKNFSGALERIGFMAQLITLPQFHTEAERGYSVARAYREQGIEGYVQNVQRVEEHLPSDYTFLGHQKAVGTAVEAQLYDNLFARSSEILKESTEKHFH